MSDLVKTAQHFGDMALGKSDPWDQIRDLNDALTEREEKIRALDRDVRWAANRIDDLQADLQRARAETAAYRSAVVPLADYTRAVEQRNEALAMADGLTREVMTLRDSASEVTKQRCLQILRDVMATLAKSAGGPAEVAVWREADSILAENGYAPPEADVYRAAYAEWEAKR